VPAAPAIINAAASFRLFISLLLDGSRYDAKNGARKKEMI
jgi:hypothetical protein